ncbi:MAG: DUF1015 domain-containing protein [Candidatus Korobacteraceae bacterium]|jgi:uncharacterized protein (DUF1015 family)
MAEIRPFHALHFDSSKVKLADVLTQPYDKITPAMQDAYYRRSPHSLVRFELGKPEPGDNPSSNVYTRAADFLREAQSDGVLRRDAAPCIYAYVQKFSSPTQSGERMLRTGVIALGRIYDYEDRVVFRHEQTLAKPKADRCNLLQATRTHSGQLFMIYEDAKNEVENIVCAAVANRAADECVVDEYGVENLLWRIDDPKVIERIAAAMRDKRLLIADGHHRYETAREYRDACRANSSDRSAPHEFVMMTLVNMNSPGLVVLPTHRVVFGVEGFGEKMERGLLELGGKITFTNGSDVAFLAKLEAMGREGTAFGVVTAGGRVLVRLLREKVDALLGDVSEPERKLDVVVLHELVLNRILGISAEAVHEQRNVRYFRSADEAVEQVSKGANAAFLLNPVSLKVMRDLCYAGRVMPQKSTDFYPKLLSGLTLDNLDQCF